MASDEFGNFDDNLTVRVNSKVLSKFKKKCVKVSGKTYPMVVREIMAALIDGRLHITPTKEQKNHGELYK